MEYWKRLSSLLRLPDFRSAVTDKKQLGKYIIPFLPPLWLTGKESTGNPSRLVLGRIPSSMVAGIEWTLSTSRWCLLTENSFLISVSQNQSKKSCLTNSNS